MYINQTLAKNEKIEKIFKLNWTNYIKGYLYLFIMPPLVAWFFHILKQDFFSLNYVLVIVPVLMLILPFFLVLKNIEQGVTNRRLIYKEGIFARKTNEIRLEAIQTVEIEQGFWARVFGSGTVHVTGRGNGEITFSSIDNPLEVKRFIETAAEERETYLSQRHETEEV